MANDVNIVIGAQDQASKILQDVAKNTEKMAAQMGKSVNVTQGMKKTFDFAVKGFLAFKAASIAVSGAVKAVTASIAGMQSSVEAFQNQEKAAKGMTQAQLDFASALQKSTNIGDEATLSLMKYAETMGYTKEISDDVVLAAAGLARKFGIDQKDAIGKVTSALMGNTSAFEGLLPGLGRVYNEFQKLEIVQAAMAEGLQMLQEDTATTAGAMKRSEGAFGDLSEKIGALFDPIFQVTHTGLAVFAETMQTMLMPAIAMVNKAFESSKPLIDALIHSFQMAAVVAGTALEVILSMVGGFFDNFTKGAENSKIVGDLLKSTFENMASMIIKSLTFMEVAWNKLPTVIGFAVDSVLLFLEGMRADIAHTFTVVIPAYASWFGENFTNIISDTFVAAKKILTNFFERAAALVETGWTFLTSKGKEGAWDFAEALATAIATPLTSGFEATTDALPNIAERAATETEKRLSGQIGKSAQTLANEYERKVQERLDKLKTSMDTTVDIKQPKLQEMKLEVSGKLGNALSGIQAQQAVTGRLLTRGRDDTIQRRIFMKQAEAVQIMREMLRTNQEAVRVAKEKGEPEKSTVLVMGNP